MTATWGLVLAAIAATYIWRLLGTVLSRHIDPDGLTFQWVACVAYAMLAGLVARMIWLPVGVLAEVPLWIRLISVGGGLAVFFIAKHSPKRLILAVMVGMLVFIALVSGVVSGIVARF